MEPTWKKILVQQCKQRAPTLAQDQISQLGSFIELLGKWNRSIRLTGDASPEHLAAFHVPDGLEVAAHMPEVGTLIDVGSGGGLPGIIIAITKPQLAITMVEPIAKKTSFLRSCARQLGLANTSVITGRDEDIAQTPAFEPFDAAVSRATWSADQWIQRGRALVRDGGTIFALTTEEVELSAADYYDYIVDSRKRRIYKITCGRQ